MPQPNPSLSSPLGPVVWSRRMQTKQQGSSTPPEPLLRKTDGKQHSIQNSDLDKDSMQVGIHFKVPTDRHLLALHATRATLCSNNPFEAQVVQIPDQAWVPAQTSTNKNDKAKPDDTNTNTESKRPTKITKVFALEPCPVVELLSYEEDPNGLYRASPHMFCQTDLIPCEGTTVSGVGMTGTMVSSLHKVKIREGEERAYFVFPHLYPRFPGRYSLKFTIFELRTGHSGQYAKLLSTVYSTVFAVNPSRGAGPPIYRESPDLVKILSRHGLKLKVRKAPNNRRTGSRKPGGWVVGQSDVRSEGPMILQQPASVLGPPSEPTANHTQGVHPAPGSEDIQNRISFSANGQSGIASQFNNSGMSAVRLMHGARPTMNADNIAQRFPFSTEGPFAMPGQSNNQYALSRTENVACGMGQSIPVNGHQNFDLQYGSTHPRNNFNSFLNATTQGTFYANVTRTTLDNMQFPSFPINYSFSQDMASSSIPEFSSHNNNDSFNMGNTAGLPSYKNNTTITASELSSCANRPDLPRAPSQYSSMTTNTGHGMYHFGGHSQDQIAMPQQMWSQGYENYPPGASNARTGF